MVSQLATLLSLLDQFREGVAAKAGAEEADVYMELMRELVHRLPHGNLLAATRAEIQAAGQVMLVEGYSEEEMRRLQSALAGLYDLAVAAGLLETNVVRSKTATRTRPVEVADAVLAVGFTADQVKVIGELLGHDAVEVVRKPSAQAGLTAVMWYPFRTLLCWFPLRGMDTGEFLAEVRGEHSLCRHSGIILLPPPAQKEEAAAFLGRGANRVLTLDAVPRELRDAVAVLEGVSRRAELRLPVRVLPPNQQQWDALQSVNVSESGLLLRSPKIVPKGTEVELEIALPGEPGLPIRARGEVVRATSPTRERVRGVAVRFLSFQGHDKFRYDEFLRQAVSPAQ